MSFLSQHSIDTGSLEKIYNSEIQKKDVLSVYMVGHHNLKFLQTEFEKGVKSLCIRSGKHFLLGNSEYMVIFVNGLIDSFSTESFAQVMHFLLTANVKFYGELSIPEITDKYFNKTAGQFEGVNNAGDKGGRREVDPLSQISKTWDVITDKHIKK